MQALNIVILVCMVWVLVGLALEVRDEARERGQDL